jgi:GIY-YIG catalytic domain
MVTYEAQVKAIKIFIDSPNSKVIDIANEVGVSRKTIYEWKKQDWFSEAIRTKEIPKNKDNTPTKKINVKSLMDGGFFVSRDQFEPLNKSTGIYVLYTKEEDVLYVGMSSNLDTRIKTHFFYKGNTNVFQPVIYKALIIPIKNKFDLEKYEKLFIKRLKPIFNGTGPMVSDDLYGYVSYYHRLPTKFSSIEERKTKLEKLINDWRTTKKINANRGNSLTFINGIDEKENLETEQGNKVIDTLISSIHIIFDYIEEKDRINVALERLLNRHLTESTN